MSERKVPKLRFAGFTDDWKQRKLGDILRIKSGMSQKNIEKENGIYPILATGGEIGRTDTALYVKESVLIGRKGTIDKPYYMNTPFWTVDTLFYSELFPDTVGLFVYALFQTIDWRSYDTSTGVPSLTSTTIHSINVKIPPSETEQQAIGEFFKQLDDTIAFHQREWEKYKNLKISYLEKMFPQENENKPQLRFPNFTDAWKQRKLKDISQKVLEKNLNMEFLETFTNSAELGIISQRDFFDKDIANVNNLSGYYIVRNNDFVYNPRISNFAPVGPIKRNKLGRSGAMSPLYYVFRVCDEIDFAFLETYFSSTKWHSFMKENGDTGARADRLSIKDNVFIEMPIYFPTLPEQQAIGEFFKQLDDTIAFHQREWEKYQQLKQVLLDQLFV